jgi:hypothetical protein
MFNLKHTLIPHNLLAGVLILLLTGRRIEERRLRDVCGGK